MAVPQGSTRETGAIVVAVCDPVLASSLELTLVAGGLATIVHDVALGLDDLPLDEARVLIVGPQVLEGNPLIFVDRLRSRAWSGRVILLTGDGDKLRRAFVEADGVDVLEMPFVGADLLAVVQRRGRPQNREG